MDEPLPLAALLSFALGAFTLEIDNAAESLIPHRATRYSLAAKTLPEPLV